MENDAPACGDGQDRLGGVGPVERHHEATSQLESRHVALGPEQQDRTEARTQDPFGDAAEDRPGSTSSGRGHADEAVGGGVHDLSEAVRDGTSGGFDGDLDGHAGQLGIGDLGRDLSAKVVHIVLCGVAHHDDG